MVFVYILMGITSIFATSMMAVIVLQIAQDSVGASDTFTILQRTSIVVLFHQVCILVHVLVVIRNTIKTILPRPRMIWLHLMHILIGRDMQKLKVSLN